MDRAQLTLALVEAQVGSLVDVLPVALLVTTRTGEILRANSAATDLLGGAWSLVGRQCAAVLASARRKQPLKVRLRWLRHDGEVLRLYVIHPVT
jgi:PAS domain-containing protein